MKVIDRLEELENQHKPKSTNDLTVCKLTKRKYKTPKGRMVRAKIITTIIDDCKKQYGSCINGYFHIPKDCYLGE